MTLLIMTGPLDGSSSWGGGIWGQFSPPTVYHIPHTVITSRISIPSCQGVQGQLWRRKAAISPIGDSGGLGDVPDLGDVGGLGQPQAARLQRAAVVGEGVVDLTQNGSRAVRPGAVQDGGRYQPRSNKGFPGTRGCIFSSPCTCRDIHSLMFSTQQQLVKNMFA